MCHPEVPVGAPVPDVERIEVEIPLVGRQERMPALMARPKTGAGAGVLVVCDVYGRSPFYEDLAGRLALAGFTALVPEYFFRQEPLAERTRELAMARREQLDQNQTLVDLEQSIDWLKLQPFADGRVGTIGFCMGGTLVLDLAALRDDLATVCFYGFPAGGDAVKGPPTPLTLTERMSGPILGFWGDQDAGVGMENVEKLASALRSRGADFEYRIHPGLGHGFMAQSQLDPAHEAYQAACESWTRTVDFYRGHLASRPVTA
ncbi:MAG TPA: dienelactone hydrolase family protein [Candidatus Dormibacteraeota bacterium]|nr:dienelactone hydrolase family protein [Candidatus Dormibacteraeota bacterium]